MGTFPSIFHIYGYLPLFSMAMAMLHHSHSYVASFVPAQNWPFSVLQIWGAKVVALELDVVLAAVARVMLAFAGDHWADSAHGFPLTLGYFGPFWVILLAILGHILGYLGYLSTFWVHFGPSLNWVSTGSSNSRPSTRPALHRSHSTAAARLRQAELWCRLHGSVGLAVYRSLGPLDDDGWMGEWWSG